MYEGMCEESFLRLVREELLCLTQLERDAKLRECFVNRTNTLRDEDPGHPSASNLTYSSYECLITQTYIDCLLESNYKTCKEAVKLEIAMLSLLAYRNGSHCVLNTAAPKRRPEPDVDECISAESGCSQKCVNHPGSYECTCDPGYYRLATNNRTCIRNDKDPMWLFFAHGQSIWNISLSGGSFELQKAGLQKTAVLDVDIMERRIFYADVGSNSIERLDLDGTFPQTVQKYDVDGLEGIAVDWIGRNLYSLRKADIIVQTLTGRYRRALYKGVMRLPRAIAVPLDGCCRRTIISDSGTVPHVFALSVADDLLYWSDWTYRGLFASRQTNRRKCDGSGTDCFAALRTEDLPSSLPNVTLSDVVSFVFLDQIERQNVDVEKATNLHKNGKNCTSNCDSNHIECGGTEAKCVSMLYLCDGISHCQSTEARLTACHDNKKCVAPGGLCDGVEDCWDASDEKYCTGSFRANSPNTKVNEMAA
ncbi:calcium binding EGF domain protein [Ostertagia ostertagi]